MKYGGERISWGWFCMPKMFVWLFPVRANDSLNEKLTCLHGGLSDCSFSLSGSELRPPSLLVILILIGHTTVRTNSTIPHEINIVRIPARPTALNHGTTGPRKAFPHLFFVIYVFTSLENETRYSPNRSTIEKNGEKKKYCCSRYFLHCGPTNNFTRTINTTQSRSIEQMGSINSYEKLLLLFVDMNVVQVPIVATWEEIFFSNYFHSPYLIFPAYTLLYLFVASATINSDYVIIIEHFGIP